VTTCAIGKTDRRKAVASFAGTLVAVVGWGVSAPLAAAGSINLEWRPAAQTVWVGNPVNIALYAVSSEPTTLHFSSIQAIFRWDPRCLALLGRNDTGRPPLWMYGFIADPYGLNESAIPADGDGLYIATASLGESVGVTSAGTLLTTFLFRAVAPSSQTTVSIVPCGGSPVGESFIADEDGYRVTGVLGEVAVTVLPEPGTVCLIGVMLAARWHRRQD